MKTKHIILLTLLLVLFASCGSDSNNSVGTSGVIGSRLSDGLVGDQASEVSRILSDNPCSSQYSSSAQRIGERTFYSNQAIGSNGGLPSVDMTPGVGSGSVTGVYAGISAYNDIIIIKTLSTGGFSATVSFCTFEYWINPGATVTNFMIQAGAVNDISTCSIGAVYTNNSYALIDGQEIPTSFTAVGCSSTQNYYY